MKAEQEILNSEYWQQNAERLLYSANALREKLRAIQHDENLQINFFQWSSYIRALLESEYMLLGYAIENSVKGFSIYKYTLSNIIPEGADFKYLIKNVWKVKSGHDTINIAENALLPLTDVEISLIRKLQEHSVWKGRYHIPNSFPEILEVIKPGEKDKYLVKDREVIKSIVDKIGLEIRGRV